MIERLNKPRKRFKIGLEDFRNIARRQEYLEAYDDMLERTDTDNAPWHVIASDNKMHARLTGFKVIVDTLGRDVKPAEPDLDPEVAAAAFKMWGWTPETGKENGTEKGKENGKKNGDKK